MKEYIKLTYTEEQIKNKVLEFFNKETETDPEFWQTEDSWYGDEIIDVQFHGNHPEYGNEYEEFDGEFKESNTIAGVYRLYTQEYNDNLSTDLSSQFAKIGIKLDENNKPFINATEFWTN